MSRRRSRGRASLVATALVLAWLAIARPWTIRPIEGEPVGLLDVPSYVTSIWDTRIMPAIATGAVDVQTFRNDSSSAPGMTRTAAVVVTGVVLAVDTTSRVGVAMVDVDPVDGSVDASVQVGPVFRGTTLRDVLDFMRFTDFTNQIQFAAVASALNEHVARTVIAGLDLETLAGRRVRVVGAASIAPSDPAALPLITPVEITLEGRP